MFSPPAAPCCQQSRFSCRKTSKLLPAVICLLTGFVFLTETPAVVARGRSSRGAVSRMRSMQAKQKKQTVQTLQAELAAAQALLSKAEAELSTVGPALQAAKSQLETAKEREAAQQKKSHEAAQKHHELEEKLLAEQGPDTPVGKAQSELASAQSTLDQVIHGILSLPAHPAGVTESDLANERLNLKAEQKDRLKKDTAYQQAVEKVEALRSHVNEQRRKFFEQNSEWKESHESRQTIAQELKALEENRKSAASEVAQEMRQFKVAQSAMANAQQIIMVSSIQLSALGSAPKAPATAH